jgi:hypothetical protein
MAGLSGPFVRLRIATVAPLTNPAKKAMATTRITVSFFIFGISSFFYFIAKG